MDRRAGWEQFLVTLPTPRPARRPAGSRQALPTRPRAFPKVTLPPEALLIAVAELESPAKNVTRRCVGEEEAAGPEAGVGAE